MLLFRILCIPKMPAPAFWLLTVVRWVTATMLLPSPAILFRVEAWQPHSNIGIPFKVNVGSKLTRVYRTFQVRFIITKPLLFYNCKILTVLCFLFRFRNSNSKSEKEYKWNEYTISQKQPPAFVTDGCFSLIISFTWLWLFFDGNCFLIITEGLLQLMPYQLHFLRT